MSLNRLFGKLPSADVAQALAQGAPPAVSRLVSTLVAGVTGCRTKSVPMSGDAAGMGACATSYPIWACGLLALLLAPAAHAQFDLFLVEGNTERAAPAVYDFGSLYADESASAHFRLRNTSNAPASVNVLAAAGAGFTLTAPVLPVGLAPQDELDFTAAFHATGTGTYSASLHSDGVAILLTATVAPRLTYCIDPASATAFPGTVDFGNVVRGSSAARRITIQNDTPLVLTIPAISVQGADFALLAAPPSGQALQTGQGGEFTVLFTPRTNGLLQGALTLGQAASDQQPSLIVRFDAPAQTSGTGTATLVFVGPADSAIAFASGGRNATFAIAPGDVQAVLPFQTGTTAGVLTFTVQMGGASDQQSVTIAAVPPGISTTQGVRSPGAVEIRIAGFDNTRSLGALSFTFYDASGNPIAPGAILTDASSAAAKYFAGSDLGGVFLLDAVFPVTGDTAQVTSCAVTLTNSAGSSKTQRTTF